MYKYYTPILKSSTRLSFSRARSVAPCIIIRRNISDSSETSSSSCSGDGQIFNRIAMVGAGKMAQAFMEPMISKGVQPANKFYVYDVSIQAMVDSQERYGVQTTDSLSEVITDADLIILAVKPQNLTSSFFNEMQKGKPNSNAIILSIIAGKTMSEFLNTGVTRIVRSMPNTPAMIGQGMTVWSCTSNLTADERKKIRDVLSSCGKSMYVDDESFIDMATSISGSGPAYIFMLMESMIDAGVHMGFPREKATTLVYHTMLGSTLYAMESKEHPAILRNMVTSPSGTTASALYELENGRFRTVIKDAMWACYRRSLEMGNHDSNVGPGRAHFPEPRIVFSTTPNNTNTTNNNINNTSSGTVVPVTGIDLAERIHENHNKNSIHVQYESSKSKKE